jgi:hypothetical protein
MAIGEVFAVFLEDDPLTLALPQPVLSDDRLAIVRSGETYYVPAGSFGGTIPSCTYVVAVNGGTTVATDGLGAVQLEPAAAIATYTVTLPPNATDNQIFGVSTTQDISALTGGPAAGQSVNGGAVGVLPADGGVAWRYRASNTTWYRI